MGHSHDDRLHAEPGRHVDDLLHSGDHDLATLQPEPLLRGELLRQERLEAGGARQPGQNQPLLLVRVVHDVGRLEPLTDPVALLERVDEHELDADLVAVRLLQPAQDLAQGQELFLATDEGRAGQLEGAVHVGFLCGRAAKDVLERIAPENVFFFEKRNDNSVC